MAPVATVNLSLFFYKETRIDFSLQQLVSNGANVVVVTHPGSSSKLPSGVKVATVDLTDVNALTKAFKENNIEVVVPTVSMAAIPGEHLLVDAAKAAGVQLFIVSEFGHSTVGRTSGIFGAKAKAAEYLQQIGLAMHDMLSLTNFFVKWYIHHLHPLVVDSGKFKILGKGDKKSSFTHIEDIAGFTAYVITHLQLSQLAKKIFRIEGESATMLEISKLYAPKFAVEEFKNCLQRLIENAEGPVTYDIPSKDLVGDGLSNQL